jgi:uncharacterized protein (UPF0264 family)
MPLLVSVRNAEEVTAALAGGADIIDAKEPARGGLGPVAPEVLDAIAARTPAWVPLSVALGDHTGDETVRAAVTGVRLARRTAPVFLKVGFAGLRSTDRIASLVATAVRAAGVRHIVAVAYADHGAANTAAPVDVLRAARSGGAHGFLVDTWAKDGRGLLDHLTLAALAELAAEARRFGLHFALAGSLDPAGVSRVVQVASIVGVRGAACRGGRSGTVDAERVAELRRRATPAAPLAAE